MSPAPSSAAVAAVLAPIDPDRLRDVARCVAASADIAWLPDGAGRRWVHLVATAEYDAWLIVWPPGTRLGLHDHGGSSASVVIVDGELEERHHDIDTPSNVHTRTLRAGDAVSFGPVHVHAVGNVGDVEAVSVHVYSPPLGDMRYFE
jgi:predicted metal-dependent enzyme (double-stranded beta helix superfamily)